MVATRQIEIKPPGYFAIMLKSVPENQEMKTKTRLTITLSHDLLRKVDNFIDGQAIRNRSHAIENLIRNGLGSQVTTAVILAGGIHADGVIPGLKKINNKPLLGMTLEHLKSFGITKIVMCAGNSEATIQDELGNGSRYGVEITYSFEDKLLGTAGAVKNAAKFLDGEPFLVINDATITNLNLKDLLDFHQQEDTVATICVKPRMSEPKYGQAFLHGNKIIKFLDSSDKQGISIVNMGLYVLRPEIIDIIPSGKSVNFETDIFPQLAEKKELSAFVFQGLWFDASFEKSFKEAEIEFSNR